SIGAWITGGVSGPWIGKGSAVCGRVETPRRRTGCATISLGPAEVEGDSVRRAYRRAAITPHIPGQSRARREVMQLCIRGPVFWEARIARKVESDRRVGVHRASDALVKPVLAELKAAAFVKLGCLTVS